MAKPVSLVSLDKLTSEKNKHSALKAAGAPKEAIDEQYAIYRKLVKQRNMQQAHPVHGPMLKALDGGTSLGEAAAEEPTPQKAPKAKRSSDAELLEDLKSRYAHPDSWATPGNSQHFEDVHAAGEDLGRWAAQLESQRPVVKDSEGTIQPDPELHPVFKLLNDANKHLERHADANMSGKALEASGHLTSAALKLGNAAKELAKLGGPEMPLSSQGRTGSVDYRHVVNYVAKRAADFASETNTPLGATEKTPKNYRYPSRVPEAGYGAPVEARMSKTEKALERYRWVDYAGKKSPDSPGGVAVEPIKERKSPEERQAALEERKAGFGLEASGASKQLATEQASQRRDYAISKSLVEADGTPKKGSEAQVENLLHQVVPRVRDFVADNSNDYSDGIAELHHPKDIAAVHAHLHKTVPQFASKLGPAGIDLAIERHNKWAQEQTNLSDEELSHSDEANETLLGRGYSAADAQHDSLVSMGYGDTRSDHFNAGRGGF